MSIKDKYHVQSVDNFKCREWLLKKHYAKTLPNIMYAFGLFTDDLIMIGCCCYGTPANNHNNEQSDFKQIELVRLVVNENLERNSLSFFVSQTLKMLKAPLSLISYADVGHNHHGYIYQATNWIYTGLGGGADFYLSEDNKEIHSRIMSDLRLKYPLMSRDQITIMKRWTKVKGTFKHRYFYFVGNKQDKRKWRKLLEIQYPEKAYPKGDNTRYDASYQTTTQTQLF